MSNVERKFSKQADPHAWHPRIKTDPSAGLAHMTNPPELQARSLSTSSAEEGQWASKGGKIALAAVALAALGVGGYKAAHPNWGEGPSKQPDTPSNTRVVETQNGSDGSTHQMKVSTPGGEKTVTFELPPTETAGPALPPPPEQYAPGKQPDIEH